MSSSSTTFFQPSRLALGSAKAQGTSAIIDFKTSNPSIFPSLNPMGSFYKQHKTVRVPTTQQDKNQEKENSFTCEPVKKQKLNNGFGEVVACSSETKTSLELFNKPLNKGIDKDGFSLPKLPKRLNNTQRRVSEQVSAKPKVQDEPMLVSDDLVMPDSVMKDFQELRVNLMAMENKRGTTQEGPKSKRAPTQRKTSKKEHHGIDPNMLETLYEKLKIDYYVFFWKKRIQEFSMMNQEVFDYQHYNFSALNQSEKSMNHQYSAKFFDLSDQEPVKQEIPC